MSLTTLDGLDPEPERRGRGRPTMFTAEMAKEICDRISLGESVIKITRDEHMPTEMTVYRWVNDDRGGFAKMYADARIRQAWRYQDQIMDIADDATTDWYKDDEGNNRFDMEHYMRSRLRVDTRKWYLSKVLPKVFGDKVQHEHSGDINLKLRNASVDELLDRLGELQRKTASRAAAVTDATDEAAEPDDAG